MKAIPGSINCPYFVAVQVRPPSGHENVAIFPTMERET